MRKSLYVQTPPERRPLKIFAFDPMLGRVAQNRITVDVPYEPLGLGPTGARIRVVDFDATTGRYYQPVDLNDTNIAMQGGLDPSESDPRFHQQMVYAVATRVLENFDTALGRRLRFRRNRPLRIFPHALGMANAFYHRQLLALLFGYFRTGKDSAGPGVPGQTVFTCLSHDIIAHEMTHALVDRLRPLFFEPSNADVLAFHEGFSDIIAIFQHFSFQGILRDTIQETRSDLRSPTPLVELAREFGYATGSGHALRSAIDAPDPTRYEKTTEPHERGSLLVAAVFGAFFAIYQQRIKDLVRIATGGTGRLPEGDLHPDLVNRIGTEASRAAQSILTMCIRAFEYLPPVDITFGDYLRALVTADFELYPGDEAGQRAAVIEAFRARGIFPEHVTSLAEESLLWEGPEGLPDLPVADLVGDLFLEAQEVAGAPARREPQTRDEGGDVGGSIARVLNQYALQNAARLGLDPNRTISVRGFHPVFRFARAGRLVIELVAQFTQVETTQQHEWGGLPLRGGATVIASADGKIRYLIAKPLPHMDAEARFQQDAEARVARQVAFIEACDRENAFLPWAETAYHSRRMMRMMNLATLHRGIQRW